MPAPANEASCMIEIQVVPRSSRVAIQYLGDLHYKVKLTSPPVDGAANAQLVEVLAKQLSLPRRQIEIVSGESARRKRLLVRGATADTVKRLLPS